ncbi:hypothetical protein BT96DRAFT_229789 [Gymnopus androsaceus JB14]|uniref:DUF6535 domain-containing protein n=1 Tax=Gymnopus androsaceus JB14 TaxID=1447944 RepID=A0A6A4H7A2_9AGAR|nr:hypothetical protein BT96DRAFT_229789 [Gymnopus androsaceus JB14]
MSSLRSTESKRLEDMNLGAAPSNNYDSGDVCAEELTGKSPLLWREDKPYRCAPPNTGDPWTECLNSVRTYDDEKCKGWREDIDTLLVFAGLFSATVTAFATESYQWLQQDTDSAIFAQLVYISERLNGSTSPAPAVSAFTPAPVSIRINVFWFLSLTISLAAVLVGILCKQWLREYQKDPSVCPHLALELRQMRYESLQKWGVPEILSALPLLLQLALVLFFAGMLDLLWSLNPVVAGLVTAVVGLSMFIVVATSVLPSCYILMKQRQSVNAIFPCPYKSPQSWLFHRLILSISSLASRNRLSMPHYSDWVSFDLHILRALPHYLAFEDTTFLQRGLRWVVGTFGDSFAMTRHIFHCLQSCSTQEFAYATHQDSESSRDSLNLNFLESRPWDESDFAIRRFAIELSLRQLNNPTGSSASASGLLRKVAALVYHDDLPDLGEELWGQIIASIRNHLSTDRACVDDVFSLLEIFENCWPLSSPALQQQAFFLLTISGLDRAHHTSGYSACKSI